MGNIFFILLFFWAILCFIPASIASGKGRSGAGFFMLSFFFSPLIGLIAALIASPAVKPQTVIVNQPSEIKHNQTEDHVATLERLSELKNKGLLTEAEFVAEKTKLLGESLMIIFIGSFILFGCEKKYSYDKPTPADSMMTPAPAPAPATPLQDYNNSNSSTSNNALDEKMNKYESEKNEWTNFRNNEEKSDGKKVTWTIKVASSNFGEDIWGRIDDVPNFDVIVTGDNPIFTYNAMVYMNSLPEGSSHPQKFPKIHDNDWITVTGKFFRVNSEGMIVISPIKIQNHGTVEP